MTGKCLAYLLLFSLVDVVIPVPILGGLLVFVVLARPVWFREMVEDLYGTGTGDRDL